MTRRALFGALFGTPLSGVIVPTVGNTAVLGNTTAFAKPNIAGFTLTAPLTLNLTYDDGYFSLGHALDLRVNDPVLLNHLEDLVEHTVTLSIRPADA